MADFNGLALWSDDPARPRGGVVLYLRDKATDDATVTVDGCSARITSGSRCVMITGIRADSFESCLATGVESGNRALDLLAIGAFATASLADPGIEHIAWIDGPDGVHARLWCAARMAVRTGLVTLEVRDAAGNLVQPNAEPVPEWHEGFRYFRLAQTTDDLFDAFRNLYLALEAMLSSIEGQRLRADGRPDEGEGAWFRRALDTAATLVDLARYTVAADASTAADDLYAEMYVKVRTAVFHAKTGRPVLIPLDAASRPEVMDALKRLGRLFVDLSEKVCGTRYRSGGVFAAGFHFMSEPLVNATRVFLSNDESEFDPDARVVSGPGTVHCDIPASRAVDVEEPFFTAAIAEIAGDKVAAAVPFVSMAVLAASDTEPLLGHTLEGRLRPEGLARLSIVLGVRATNTRMLRDRYGG